MIPSRRTLIAASIAIAVATIGLLVPASVANAQDDLICARSDTRLGTPTRNPEGDYVTTLIGYCAEWIWRPPTAASHTKPSGDHDPDGGKGGTPDEDKMDCDYLKRLLAERIWERDELTREIPLMEATIVEMVKREAEDRADKRAYTELFIMAQQGVERFMAQYVYANDLETESVYSPKYGVEIIKVRSNYNVDPTLPGGADLISAIEDQDLYRGYAEAAHDRWEETVSSLESGREGLAKMRAQLAALGPLIEELLRMANDCK